MIRRRSIVTMLSAALTLAGCNRVDEGEPGANESGLGGRPSESAAAKSGDQHVEGEAEHADEVVLSADAIARYGVTVESAQTSRLQPTFVVPARIGFNAEAMAHVGSPLSGRIVDLKARLGEKVSAGDPLLIVESPALGAAQSDYLVKRTSAETAAPAVDLAKASWDRARSLFDTTQGVTLTDVQQREAEYKAATAALKAAQAEALAAENQLHLLGMPQEQVVALAASGEVNPRLTLVAPIAGEVVQREVTLGELVHPEREALLVLADMRTLWVLAEVPEARMSQVARGATAWINAGTLDTHHHDGVVSYVAPAVDPKTRTVTVRIVVECEDRSLKPGSFVQVEIVGTSAGGAEPPPVVAVPEQAIQTVEGRPAVFVPVAGEENTFATRAVVVGRKVGRMVPIVSGLKEGEAFVATGSFILKAELGKGSAEHSH